jgi:hypothetical protein
MIRCFYVSNHPESRTMDIPKDPTEMKKWMMEVIQEYGEEFLVFGAEDQPNVFAQPEPPTRKLKSGNVDPHQVKSWRYLDFTLKLLQARYEIFTAGDLIVHCPFHQIHPVDGEDPEAFREAFQLVAKGTIGFRCRRALGCERLYCSFRTRQLFDLYDLVAALEKRNREHARKVVSAYYEDRYGKRLGHFAKTGTPNTKEQPTLGPLRYAVSKAELAKLFAIPMKGKGARERFVGKALERMAGSPVLPYDGLSSDIGDAILFSKAFDWKTRLPEMGISARLFLWVHWKQAEAGSRLCLTDQSVADALEIDRRTVQAHKKLLIQGGYLAVEEAEDKKSLWSAKYETEK